jgi:hypothetical protein
MLRNALKLISRPRLACDYLEFLWSKAQHGGDVIRVLPGGLEIGGLSGFSEFHSCANFVNAAKRRFLRDFLSMMGRSSTSVPIWVSLAFYWPNACQKIRFPPSNQSHQSRKDT